MSGSVMREWLFAGQGSHVNPEATFVFEHDIHLFQLVFFGLSNQMVVAFKEENTVAFKHLFLKGYMDRMDDTYAVYTQTDVYDQIFFAINQVRFVTVCHSLLVYLFFFHLS